MIPQSFRRAYAVLERFGAYAFRRIDDASVRMWRAATGIGAGKGREKARWPVTPGAFMVGDLAAPVAVCTLTSHELVRAIAGLPGVAIAGRLVTCNLGIEKIIANVCANPNIRGLLMCGKDSPIFRPSQSLRSLFERGLAADKSIVGATGYLPVLQGADPAAVEEFRRRITLVDRTGLAGVADIQREVSALVDRLSLEHYPVEPIVASVSPPDDDARFTYLRPGGRRESLAYDPNGYLVFSIDRANDEIVARHYTPTAEPRHIMRGRSAEGMALALIREQIVTQMTHAAYIGGELAKAETALRMDLEYEQDKPLRKVTRT